MTTATTFAHLRLKLQAFPQDACEALLARVCHDFDPKGHERNRADLSDLSTGTMSLRNLVPDKRWLRKHTSATTASETAWCQV